MRLVLYRKRNKQDESAHIKLVALAPVQTLQSLMTTTCDSIDFSFPLSLFLPSRCRLLSFISFSSFFLYICLYFSDTLVLAAYISLKIGVATALGLLICIYVFFSYLNIFANKSLYILSAEMIYLFFWHEIL